MNYANVGVLPLKPLTALISVIPAAIVLILLAFRISETTISLSLRMMTLLLIVNLIPSNQKSLITLRVASSTFLWFKGIRFMRDLMNCLLDMNTYELLSFLTRWFDGTRERTGPGGCFRALLPLHQATTLATR